MQITITITGASHALLDNLRIARAEKEGITIETGGGRDFVEVKSVRDDG